MQNRRILPLSLALLPMLMLGACGEMPKLGASNLDPSEHLGAYRQDIRQGNYVSQEMVAQLKPGLTREQVRYVLGTPLVTDPFHGSRWDYVYRYVDGRNNVQQRTLSVYFDAENKLMRVGGDVMPMTAGVTAAKPEPAPAAAPASTQ